MPVRLLFPVFPFPLPSFQIGDPSQIVTVVVAVLSRVRVLLSRVERVTYQLPVLRILQRSSESVLFIIFPVIESVAFHTYI
jgi:uncharacterized membrane protein